MARSGILIMLAAIVLAFALLPAIYAATFNCTIRVGSCNSNETLLVRLNSTADGYNNSHAQLPNSTDPSYPYSVCCWTDAFRTLNNTCSGTSTAVLKLANTTDSHVQDGTQSGYAFSACLNVTYGSIGCEYPNNACSAGYSPVLSMASSESGDNNLTNAHIGDFTYYYRKTCCQIGGQNPPVVAYANISPNGTTTTRIDLECQNGSVTDADGDSVTLHYNWYRNGTSIALANFPMDYNGSHSRDISGNNFKLQARNGAVFLPTGGRFGGAFTFDGIDDDLSSATDIQPGLNFTVTAWVKTSSSSLSYIVGAGSESPLRMAGTGQLLFTLTNGTFINLYSSGTINNDAWHHVVAVLNGTNASVYIDGTMAGSRVAIDAWPGKFSTVGRRASGTEPFNGTIDEVIIYSRALSPQEIRTLYLTGNMQLNSTELRRTEGWNCSITPVDSTGLNGTTKYSNMTVVNGSAPLVPTLTYPVNNNQSVFERFANFTWTQADERDGDTVSYTLNLTVATGACSVQTTQSNLLTVNYTYGELCTDQLYNWTINACDTDGCSGPSSQSNFTVASVVGLRLVVNRTQFGSFERGQSKATDADSIAPFVINNTGNVRINVTLVGNNSPFSSVALPSSYYQFKVGVNLTNAFNETGSQSTYTPIDSAYKALVKQLNYSSEAYGRVGQINSTAGIHLNITAPMDEPPGEKRGNITVRAVAS